MHLSTRAAPLALALALALAGCAERPSPTPAKASEATPAKAPVAAAKAPVAAMAPPEPVERVVAIGDIHGDLRAARKALRTAGAIDERDAWIGGKLVVVQTGDQLDRGKDDREVLDLFEKLKGEASATGGRVLSLSGNHEIMNASFDFRYVAQEAYPAFSGFTPTGPMSSRAARYGDEKRGRASAFAPGGVYARMLSERPVIARIGDSVFAHAGVHRKHVDYGIDRINDGVKEWLAGRASEPPAIAVAEDGPVWTRAYSNGPVSAEACRNLDEVLTRLGVARLVMGHTVQEGGATSACDGKAWRVDVGMCEHYGGPVEVLEIKGGAPRVLRAK